MSQLPRTLGELRNSSFAHKGIANRSVKDELRATLIAKIQKKEKLFPGIVGYEDTVVPQVVNAVLSRHNFILLGLRGQAKTRLVRMLTTLLDPHVPYIAGTEIHDNPFHPISKVGKNMIEEMGDETPIGYLIPEQRYVEKLATPDVTIADMIGDIDPIKAARRGQDIGDELTVHYGLLPRANRGIFAVNELPDLAGKIQVGLFNIMQEGDVQIKGYPVRLPIDVMLVFTANPEDYTARGKIITPLKDRIGSEIRTHYPAAVEQGLEITAQEAWLKRPSALELRIPKYILEVVEQLAFSAREDKRVDKRSGVSQRLPISVMENVASNAERRALRNDETVAVPRVLDIYAALPSITGKIELEYEGELKGGDTVARELIRQAVGIVFSKYYEGVNVGPIVHWFDIGGTLKLDETVDAEAMLQQLTPIQGLMEKVRALGLGVSEPDALRASAAEFILEGLHAHKRINRNEESAFVSDGGRNKSERRQQREPREDGDDEFPPRDRQRRKYN
jgi:magnesium chelatase subunit I